MKTYGSLTDYFSQQAKNSRASIIYSDGVITTQQTMGELYDLSLKIGKYLSDQGIQKGDPVGLMVANRPEWFAIYMGIINAGGTAVPMDMHLSAIEVRNLIHDSKPRFFFIERGLLKQLRDKGLDDMVEKYIVLDSDIFYLRKSMPFKELQKFEIGDWKPRKAQAEDIASLIYTSGTTGNPKGVPLTHRNFLSQIYLGKNVKLTPSDAVLLILPLNHAYAFATCFLMPLSQGQSIHILNSLKRTDLLRFIQAQKTSVLVLVPAILEPIYQSLMEKLNFAPNSVQMVFHTLKRKNGFSRDGSKFRAIKKTLFKKVHEAFGGNLKCIISGAAGLDEEIARTFNTFGLTLYEGYGLTETSPVVAMNAYGQSRPGTVGYPLSGLEMKILHPDDQGVGEIAIRGEPVFKGYRNADNSEVFTRDGFFRTGDLGSLRDGFLTINGRAKDVIVLASGKNVFPEDLEHHFLKNEYIKEIAVIGVPMELGKKAEGIFAFVVPNQEALQKNSIPNPDEFILNLSIELSEQLPTWCRIANFHIQNDPLPRTTTRKVKKFQLKNQVLEQMKKTGRLEHAGAGGESDPLLKSPMGKILNAAICHVKGEDVKYGIRSHLFVDLGFDSISVSELVVTLEKSLGLTIPKDLAYQLRTVRDAITSLQEFSAQNKIDLESIAQNLGVKEEKRVSWEDVIVKNVPQEIQAEIDSRVGAKKGGSHWVRSLLTPMLSAFGKTAFRLKATGLENLPRETRFIIAADHLSYSDPLFIQWALPKNYRRHFFFIGKKENLQRIDRTLFGWIARMIPIDREGNFIPALQAGKRVLDSENILLIHPEGTPSADKMLNKFKNGVGILGDITKVPIIPVHLEGTFEALPKNRNRPRFVPVTVHFGEPIFPDRVEIRPGEELFEMLTKEVERRIIELGALPRPPEPVEGLAGQTSTMVPLEASVREGLTHTLAGMAPSNQKKALDTLSADTPQPAAEQHQYH